MASTALSQSDATDPSDSWPGTQTSAVGGRRVGESAAVFNVPFCFLRLRWSEAQQFTRLYLGGVIGCAFCEASASLGTHPLVFVLPLSPPSPLLSRAG